MSTKLIIIIGVLCSSLSSVFGRFSDASSTMLVFYRMLFTVLISVPLTVGKNKEELFSISGRNLLFSILSGALLGIHFVVYFTAVSYTSISSCTTLASMEAFFVAFALVFIFKEKVSAKSWIGIVVTFAGACLIAVGDFGSGNIKGEI